MLSNKSNHQKKNQKLKLVNPLHKALDTFIQTCLNKFKFVDPPQNFDNISNADSNSIISYKSTIPDLVIWNQTFNKNECFENSDLSKVNPFPRFQFFLRFNQNKEKKKRKNRKNKKNKNKNNVEEKNLSYKSNLKYNSENNVKIKNENKIFDENKTLENVVDLMEKIDMKNTNSEKSQDCDDNKINEIKDEKSNRSSISNKSKNNIDFPIINKDNSDSNKISNNQYEPNISECTTENNDNMNKQISINYVENLKNNSKSQSNLNNKKLSQNPSLLNNNFFQNRIPYYNNNYMGINPNNKNNIFFQNKFSVPSLSIIKNKKSINDYYRNQFKQNELLMNFVYSYLDKKGWIIFKNGGNYIWNFTSFELFSFLTNILKNNGDLKLLMIGMHDNSMVFNGEQIYIILSQTLPIILQKKQCELIQNENIKKQMKEKEIDNTNINKINNNNINEKDILNICDNNYAEDNMDDNGINDEDNNLNFNFNNNFFSSQPQGNIYDNFDSSIFCQSK